jgi:hypothetical protein
VDDEFTAPDGRTLQWVLRSQLGKGPLALLALRGFTLPDQIFSVDSAATAQALMANTETVTWMESNNEHSAESGCRLSGGRN